MDDAKRKTTSEKQQLLADLFHALNQPLTTLQCWLEIATREFDGKQPSREEMTQALQHIAAITRLTSGLREWLDAEDVGDELEMMRLDRSLREVASDLRPLAETRNVQLSLAGPSSAEILFEPRRLRQALFRLLEFAIQTSLPGSALEIRLSRASCGEMGLTAAVSAQPRAAIPDSDCSDGSHYSLEQRLSLAIAEGVFEAAGVRISRTRDRHQQTLKICLSVCPSSGEDITTAGWAARE